MKMKKGCQRSALQTGLEERILEFTEVKKEGGSHLSKNRLNRVAMDFSPLAAS
jgi:hypothetical protein